VIDPTTAGDGEQNPLTGTEIHATNEEQTGSSLRQAEAHNDGTEREDDAHAPNQAVGQRGQEEIRGQGENSVQHNPVASSSTSIQAQFLHPIQVILSDRLHVFVTASPSLKHTHMVLSGTMINLDFLHYQVNHIT
jgi:hypothetical protein